ncbi:SDR family NAD(P)-dependent oxidoreductase [Mycolicibacterium mengxianglii]|uniref:SDR family NAD(P)-dependent oxidoreductase n=1 Tax=Mycolicibacterium mengxianglii TaxID=2736649 RepID=UPI0018CFF509|nr:SDR family NAD(P)-dependent oxidoreductase [Mycolicibacterium mengxianglii]
MKPQPVALVTGATSGIGEATAHRLQAQNYLVFAVGRNPSALDALRSQGFQARTLDVTDEPAVTELVDEINTDHGGVDVLVNSAGFPLRGPLEQVALNDLRSLFETHVVGPLQLSQAVLPGMRARRTGIIVNIGSTGGRFTSPGAGAYHVSKYGLEALSLALRAELMPFGVRVVLIDPTGVRTRFVEAQLEETRSYANDDPYGEFKRRYDEAALALTKTPGVMVDADTVARFVMRVVKAKNPKPRYIVGLSGHATILAQTLLTDRMWERITLSRLAPR